jgi:hypothetical protein
MVVSTGINVRCAELEHALPPIIFVLHVYNSVYGVEEGQIKTGVLVEEQLVYVY